MKEEKYFKKSKNGCLYAIGRSGGNSGFSEKSLFDYYMGRDLAIHYNTF